MKTEGLCRPLFLVLCVVIIAAAHGIRVQGQNQRRMDALPVPLASDMTLRDYFAASVITGLASNRAMSQHDPVWAYRMADRMLEERLENE